MPIEFLSKLSKTLTFFVIDIDLDDEDKETYRDLGTPVLNMIWMRNWPVFKSQSKTKNKIYSIIHRIGRYVCNLILTIILIILQLLIPLWFMYMLFAHYFSDEHDDHDHRSIMNSTHEQFYQNVHAFNKMSGLNPCDPNTAYETNNYIQIIGFSVAIGSLAVIIFKAEEDILRITYWAVIYSRMENGVEKFMNCLLLAISSVLVFATATGYISCTLYYAGITAENALPSDVDNNYGFEHGINVMFLIAQLPALIVMMEFDDIIRGHIRFDNNNGTTICSILEKIERKFLKIYSKNHQDSTYLQEIAQKKTVKVELSAIKLAKLCHHFTLVIVVFTCMVVIFDVTEVMDVKFIDFYDKLNECE